MTVSTDGGGKKWHISSRVHFTSPPATNEQVVFDVSEDESANLALVLHIAAIRHYIERDQDANFAVIETSELIVDPDIALSLVEGINNFLGDSITECIEDIQPWHEYAVKDFDELLDQKTNPRLKALIGSVPDGFIYFLNRREEFMAYYSEKWNELLKGLSLPESSAQASGEQSQQDE